MRKRHTRSLNCYDQALWVADGQLELVATKAFMLEEVKRAELTNHPVTH